MAHAGSNACTVVMDTGGSNDISLMFNTSALCRELQECLSETLVTMERQVGDSYAGKESDNTQDESNNNSSVIVRDVGGSCEALSVVADDCDTSMWFLGVFSNTDTIHASV